jgi:hypothetical protein
MGDIVVKTLVIIIAIVIAVFFIADQIRCFKHLYDFRGWQIGDQGLYLFPGNEGYTLIELVAIDFDKDQVVVQTVAEKGNYLLSSKDFLENVVSVRHEEDS